MYKNALVSVSDKTGLVEFLRPLVKKGLRVVSTGGTSQHLKNNGIPVTEVSEQTGFPEVMDGRVRTLHPNIHVPLLARHNNIEDQKLMNEMHLQAFDLVIVNLYPFEQNLNKELSEDERVELIDIGGPTLLRAAAKNYSSITVVCDPNDYSQVLEGTSLSMRRQLAGKVFSHVSCYDSVVANYFNKNQELNSSHFNLGATFYSELRYGENSHQKASWFKQAGSQTGLWDSQILQGKELSYNNLLDLEAAVSTLRDFTKPTCVAVKHNNSCGVGSSHSPEEALVKAISADPKSVFGGIIACNFEISANMAQHLSSLFLECILAPSVSESAKALLKSKKNLRVLAWPNWKHSQNREIRSVSGSILVQEKDNIDWSPKQFGIVGNSPSPDVWDELEFAWLVVKNLKSNAIAITNGEMTLGLGMGQVNRVEAVEHAINRWKQHHANVASPVLASDAFFPFADSIDIIADAGIQWIIQPGGSLKDSEVFERASQRGVNLVITKRRHFRH